MDSDPSENPTEPAGTAVPPPTPPESTLPPPAPTPAPALTTPPAPPIPPVPPVATPPPSAAPPPPGGPRGGDRRYAPPLPQLVTELREMVVNYFKQQTIIPLKDLGRYVGFGLLGSLLFGFGVVFLALGGVAVAARPRPASTFTGDWSWVPVPDHGRWCWGSARPLVWLLRNSAGDEEGGHMTAATRNAPKTVTRADIEAKLAEIRGATDTTAEVAEEATKPVLVVLAVALVIGAFLLGRRRGQKRSTIVEIRRV